MGCSGRYADAWQFASFWCVAPLLSRVDDGVGSHGMLTDSQADFISAGVYANNGMVLYNVTSGASGTVTAVDTNLLTASLSGGTRQDWRTGDVYRIVLITAQEIATVNQFLEIAAADIHAALGAAGACDCELAPWAESFLVKLNIIDMAALYRCPCLKPDISDSARGEYLTWVTNQLELIRQGKLEVCDGETGADQPAMDVAVQGINVFTRGRIITGVRE